MKRSTLFTTEGYSVVEKNVISLINSTVDIVHVRSLSSTRAIGDAIQELIGSKFPDLLPKGILNEYNAKFAKRSMADFAFEDKDGFYYIIDSKTHNEQTHFNMPNLTSVERLARFYEDDNNYFIILIISYSIIEGKVRATACHFLPIEHLDWSCLTIGALGWGQIQISNSNNIIINRKQTRKRWMLQLCDELDEFYPTEIIKIKKRITHFKRIRKYWEEHEDF